MASQREQTLASNSAIVATLKPTEIWRHFADISAIPRPSGKEDAISEYFVQFATDRNLTVKKDAVGNVLVTGPPSAGYEKVPMLTVQGHFDMVCEKVASSPIDPAVDPVEFEILEDEKGKWLTAKGTTLGADNGIGLSIILMMMNHLAEFEHGPMEFLFTVQEEAGLVGANEMEKGFFTGESLINLDSEDWGEIFVGCAGAGVSILKFLLETADLGADVAAVSFGVSGLVGGHSGLDIVHERVNGIKFLADIVRRILTQVDGSTIASFEVQSQINAIPREGSCVVVVPKDQVAKVQEIGQVVLKHHEAVFGPVDPDLKMDVSVLDSLPEKTWTRAFSERICRCLVAIPSGVLRRSVAFDGVIETSTNLGFVKGAEVDGQEGLIIGTLPRSLVDDEIPRVLAQIDSIGLLAGAHAIDSPVGCCGWTPDPNSKLMEMAKQVFDLQHDAMPKVSIIHGGLECGPLRNKSVGETVDCVSFGPTIVGAHTPTEKVMIEHARETWNLARDLVTAFAMQNSG